MRGTRRAVALAAIALGGAWGVAAASAAEITVLPTTPATPLEEQPFLADVEGTADSESLLFVWFGQAAGCAPTPAEAPGGGEWLTPLAGEPVGPGVFARTLDVPPTPVGTSRLCAWLGADASAVPDAVGERAVLVDAASVSLSALTVTPAEPVVGQPATVRVQGQTDIPQQLFVWRADGAVVCPASAGAAVRGEWVSPAGGVSVGTSGGGIDTSFSLTPRTAGTSTLCAWLADDPVSDARDQRQTILGVRQQAQLWLSVPPTGRTGEVLQVSTGVLGGGLSERLWVWFTPGATCPDRPSRVPAQGSWLTPAAGMPTGDGGQDWEIIPRSAGGYIVCAWVGPTAGATPSATAQGAFQAVDPTPPASPPPPAPAAPAPGVSATSDAPPVEGVDVALTLAGDGQTGPRRLRVRWAGTALAPGYGNSVWVGVDRAATPCPSTRTGWVDSWDQGVWLSDPLDTWTGSSRREWERELQLGPGRGAGGIWRACEYLVRATTRGAFGLDAGPLAQAFYDVPASTAQLYTLAGDEVTVRDASGRARNRLTVASDASSLGISGDGRLWTLATDEEACTLSSTDGTEYDCGQLSEFIPDDEGQEEPGYWWRIGGTGPGGELLLVGDNHTLGSIQTWRLDPRAETLTYLRPGWVRASPDMQRMVQVFRWYRRSGGGFQRIAVGMLEGGRRVVRPRPSLTEQAQAASFSPDGRRIAVVVIGPKYSRLYIGTANGTGMRRLPYRSRARLVNVAWAPDGSGVFALTENGRLLRISLNGGPTELIARGVRDVVLDTS